MPECSQPGSQRDRPWPLIMGPEAIARMEEPSGVADGPAISSGYISNRDCLDGHPDFIEQSELPTSKTIVNEGGHEVGILMAENGRINKGLVKNQRGMRGDELPKRLVPGGGGVGRANRVVPSSDIKRKTKLKSELFSISPEEKTRLGAGEHLLNKGEDMLDFLSKIRVRNTKSLILGRAK